MLLGGAPAGRRSADGAPDGAERRDGWSDHAGAGRAASAAGRSGAPAGPGPRRTGSTRICISCRTQFPRLANLEGPSMYTTFLDFEELVFKFQKFPDLPFSM